MDDHSDDVVGRSVAAVLKRPWVAALLYVAALVAVLATRGLREEE